MMVEGEGFFSCLFCLFVLIEEEKQFRDQNIWKESHALLEFDRVRFEMA